MYFHSYYVQLISDLHKFVNKIFWNPKIHCTVCVIGATKRILYAKNAPTAPIFEYLVLRSNCLHPYLLGFNSNLIPNMSIFDFQPYL